MGGRIVHLCYSGTSGASRAALNIARGSREPRRHAYVLYGTGPTREDYLAELRALGCEHCVVHKPRGPRWGAYWRTARAIVRLQPAIVVLHGSRTLPVAIALRLMRRRLPILAVQHGPSREVTRWPRRIVSLLFAMLGNRSVTVSQDMADLIRRRPLLGLACGRIAVIPNGVDAAFWRAGPRRIDPAGVLRVGMVAALEAYKDQPTLLRAAHRLREAGHGVAVHLVGGGRQEAALRAAAEVMKVAEAVHFEGDLDQEGVRRVVHSLDVLVHASHSESFGMAVVEGMLSARPVVATDAAGVREIVQHELTGLLVPEGDDAALAEALLRLWNDPPLAERLALAGRRFAGENFSLVAMAEGYERVADEVLGTR